MSNDKVIINWFPGHMAKAKKELIKKLKLVDIVIEVRDARTPISSANPLLNDLIKDTPRLIILSKSLYADPFVTKEFIKKFNEKGILALDVDLVNGKNVSLVKNYIAKCASKVIDKRKSKGIINEEVKIMVVGIPNVGKSTFINKITKRSSLNVGNRPGITKSTDVWLKLDNKYLILDTPGMLWPKFENMEDAYKLALLGTIKDELLPIQELTYFGIDYLINNYPKLLIKRYEIDELSSVEDVINKIAIKRGCLRKGGEIDLDKTYKLILQDIKNARIGAISYDRPN